MLTVICPFCHEKGRIPEGFIGKRIKCGKCNNRFLVTPPVAKGAAVKAGKVETPSPAPGEPAHEGIEVEGLEAVSWASAAVSKAEPDHEAGDGPQGVFTESHGDHATDVKEYKVLTQKDKWFEGKFELLRLEEAINHYAHSGWKVRAMTTAQVAGFSGGAKEEIVVLMER
jgi:hypothetical protein